MKKNKRKVLLAALFIILTISAVAVIELRPWTIGRAGGNCDDPIALSGRRALAAEPPMTLVATGFVCEIISTEVNEEVEPASDLVCPIHTQELRIKIEEVHYSERSYNPGDIMTVKYRGEVCRKSFTLSDRALMNITVFTDGNPSLSSLTSTRPIGSSADDFVKSVTDG